MKSFLLTAAVAVVGIAMPTFAASVVFKTANNVTLGALETYASPSVAAEAARYTNLGNLNGVDIDSNAGGELSVREIAQGWANLIYGVNSANSLTFTRLYDNLASGTPSRPNIGINPMSPLTAYTDAVWADGTVEIAFRAKYAGQNQRLGTLAGEAGTGFVASTLVAGGNTVSAFDAQLSTGGTPFRFGRNNNSNASTATETSDMSNPDVMISFLVTGPGIAEPTYAIFFEDTANGDRDFNDVAVLFSGRAGGPIIPLPGAAAMGLALMGGVGLTRARRQMA